MKNAKKAMRAWLLQAKKTGARVLTPAGSSSVGSTLQSEQGFTLIEVMVTGTIVAVMMVAFSAYMYQQAKQSQAQQNSQNYSQLKSNILGTSAQPESVSQSEALDFTTFH